MSPLLPRSIPVLAFVLGAATIAPAAAQLPADLEARCKQLISCYDRYGASRGENSDGARNHTRLGASLDCRQGRYREGIASMEALLKQKHFDVPPAPTAIAQPPATPGARPVQ